MRGGLAILVVTATAAVSSAEPVDYLRDVKPILGGRCTPCHGALRQKAGLRLDTASLIRKGGKNGPALLAGKSESSLLIDAVTGRDRPRMPPEKDGPPLTEKQIAVLRAWIDEGATAPDEPTPEDPLKHWAFQRPAKSALPSVADPTWPRNPIDHFIAAEQEKRQIRPRPGATKETLLRRVYLDLIGLPPTRDELHAFLADTSPNAYETVVDRLLSSPQYGERWGRHWMDVWRYSDWYGRRAVPDWWNSASQIWRWRDWIVTSLNADKGYDRMVVEMLAADEVAPEDDAALVATGYLARNWYALNPNQWMRDNVEHTGKAFLGLTFNCAHCHDHKYDPISQEEYFRFRAFFEPIDLRQDRVPGEPDPGPFQKYSYSVLRKPVRVGSIRVIDEYPEAKTMMYHLGDERSVMKDREPVPPGGPAFLGGDRLTIQPVSLPATAYYPGLKSFVRREEIGRCEKAVIEAKAAMLRTEDGTAETRLRAAETALWSVRARVAADDVRYNSAPGNADELSRAASLAERTATLALAELNTMVADQAAAAAKRKGDANALKQAEAQSAAALKALDAARAAMSAINAQYTPLSPVYPKTSTGRRRALAEWIASKDNPLTARVAVNHVWMRHFGKPLVETVFDFGRNGKRPTHPELLDWLAVEFMDRGWSMKHLHRLIVTSQVYRTASGGDVPASDKDNGTLWQFPQRRVEAELVRDSVLHVAGQLDSTVGGLDLDPQKEAASRRRSLYFTVYPEDGGRLAMLEQFDPPDPCDCYRRSESLVPQQALLMTNGRLMIDQGRLLARNLWTAVSAEERDEAKREAAFVTAAFEQVLTRRPTTDELLACREFLAKQVEVYRKADLKEMSATPPAGSVAPSTDPVMRSRESLVRALFSHNDFVTIR